MKTEQPIIMDLEQFIKDAANTQSKVYKTFFDVEDIRKDDKEHDRKLEEQERKYLERESFNADEGDE